MTPEPPQEQAWALLQELEALVPGLKRDLKALPELKRTQELQRLCRLWGFPKVLLGELQELLAPQEQQEETGTKAEAQHDRATNQSLEATTPDPEEEPPKRPRHKWPSTQEATKGSSVGSGGHLPHFGEEGSPPGPKPNTKANSNGNNPANPHPPHVRPPHHTQEPQRQPEAT